MPYGDALAGLPLASVGYLGVSLFFILCGMVIPFSLDRWVDFWPYLGARLLRTWPTLAVCAVLTFIVTWALGPAELSRTLPEALISLSYISPSSIGQIIGADWQWLDNAYWALWVQAQFYIAIGLLFFIFREQLLSGWVMFAAFSAVLNIAGMSGIGVAQAIAELVFADYQPFFSAGIALAFLIKQHEQRTAATLLLVSWVLAIGYTPVPANSLLIGSICGIFALAIFAALRPEWVSFLDWGPLVWFAPASFAYYLLHQNLGLALLLALPFVDGPAIFAMIVVQIGLMALSVLIAKRVQRFTVELTAKQADPSPDQLPNPSK